jgi:putative ABC transport system permease protein
MRRGLVVAEVAMAAVLLIGSGLLVKSFSALRQESPGFLTEERLVFSTQLPLERYGSPDRIRAFQREALDRVEALPGVESVGVTSLVPITGADEVYPISFEGRSPEISTGVSALLYRVSGGFLEAMGIPLLAGREIGPQDRGGGTAVALVTQSFSDRNFPGESPLGQRIRFGGNPAWAEIVGVVGDVQHYQVGQESLAQVYVPFDQEPTRQIHFVLKASLPPARMVQSLREAIHQVDPEQPLADVRPADELVSQSISLSRFRTILMTGFGLTALVLALVGLSGIVAYGVSRRSREIGIRMALGADGSSILQLILKEGLSMVGAGLGLGVAAAFGLSGLLQSFLFRVGETDPVVFAAVPAVLVAVALVAMLVPALRATKLDPVRTLGEE